MRSIRYDTYYDKVFGGWLGKCVGGNIGAAVENSKFLMDLRESEIFPDEIPPNDDLDLQLLWLHVLEQRGVHLTSRDLAQGWLDHCWYPFNEYGYFLHNFERGIDPPVSGWFNNQYFRQSMGAPIRSEIWGMIAVGDAELAMAYAAKDATLDHDTEAVWAEQMLAAIEAEAFFESDLNRLIDVGVTRIPAESKLRSVIELVRQQHAEDVSWQDARRALLERCGHPDASWAVQNLGITILALVYGGGDFGATQLIGLNCGYDTDCTCASAGAILGIVLGARGLPEEWTRQARDTFAVAIDVHRPTNRISDLATDTCRVGVAVAASINRATLIEDVPNDLGAERIPIDDFTPPVEISATYQGPPSVGHGQATVVDLTVVNHTAHVRTGRLHLSTNDGAEVSPRSIEMTLPAGETIHQPVRIGIPTATTSIPSAIAVEATWETAGDRSIATSFGLAGAKSYRLIGPFWDLYDTTRPGARPYWDPIDHRKARPRGAENFNNFVDLHRPYIDEASFASPPAGRRVDAAEDKLPLDEWFGMAGPACLYLIRDVDSPDDREARLMIGNSDPFKLWLNDAPVAESDRNWFWMPYNHDVTVRLRRGRNRIAIKALRTGKSAEFSLGIAVPETHVRWMNDLSDLVG